MLTLRGPWWGKRCSSLLAALGASVALALSRTALAQPDLPSPPAAAIDSLARSHPHAPFTVVDEWLHLDVHYDVARDGVSGTLRRGREYHLLRPAGVESCARIVVGESPLRQLKSVRVRITPAQDGPRQLDRGDLTWASMMEQDESSRVYTLDGTMSYAVIPGLRVGDRLRVEETYELRGVHGVPGQSMGGWDVPWLRSWVMLEAPADHEVVAGFTGATALRERLHAQQSQQGKRRRALWTLRAPQAAEPEDWSDGTPVRSLRWTGHLAAVAARPARSMVVGPDWSSVGEAYLERIATACEPDAAVRALATRLTEGAPDGRARIDSLYAHVQRAYRYLGLYSGLGGILPEACGAVLANGYGDCKGLGTLLIALLRAVGLEAGAALVRTRDQGPLQQDIPNLAQFNHYIAWVVPDADSEPIWLDATLDGCPVGVLPWSDAAWPVLQLRPGASRLQVVPLTAWEPGARRLQVRGAVSPHGHLQLEAVETTLQGEALTRRQWALASARTDHDDLAKILLPPSLAVQTEGSALELLQSWAEPFTIRLRARTAQPLPAASEGRFLPRTLVRLPERLKLPQPRQTDLDLRGRPDHMETWAIALPPNTVLGPVDSLLVEGPGVRWRRQVWQEGDTLRLRRSVQWTRQVFPAADAAGLSAALETAHRAEAGYFSLNRATSTGSQ